MSKKATIKIPCSRCKGKGELASVCPWDSFDNDYTVECNSCKDGFIFVTGEFISFESEN